MATPTQDPGGYYRWEVPGQPVVVHLHWDVIERLAAEVMRGFGSIPRRGAEVGGVLIGATRPGLPTIVRIDDFEPVACDYRRGPFYLLSERDGAAFEDCWRRWQPSVSPAAYAVGYFRSQTRDGFSLEAEDLDLLEHLFPGASQVALLIKPYASKVSVGGFFLREHGVFPETTPLEFPLRRRDLLGQGAAPHRAFTQELVEQPMQRYPRAAGVRPDETVPADAPREATAAPANRRVRSGWVWLPLTFLCLVLGGGLGYELALTLGSRGAGNGAQDFSLSLAVKKDGDNLSVTWSRFSAAIRSARKGVLEIDDGGYTKPVELDSAQLQNGSLTYHNTSDSVRFRLTVYPQARVSVVETLEWKR